MIVHFLWIGNKVITYIWRAKTLLISFSSLSRILYQLWDITMRNLQIPLRKIKTKEQRAGRDPLCLWAQSPASPRPHHTMPFITYSLSILQPLLRLHTCIGSPASIAQLSRKPPFSFQSKHIHGQLMPICSCANAVLYLQKIFSFLMFNLLMYLQRAMKFHINFSFAALKKSNSSDLLVLRTSILHHPHLFLGHLWPRGLLLDIVFQIQSHHPVLLTANHFLLWIIPEDTLKGYTSPNVLTTLRKIQLQTSFHSLI